MVVHYAGEGTEGVKFYRKEEAKKTHNYFRLSLVFFLANALSLHFSKVWLFRIY